MTAVVPSDLRLSAQRALLGQVCAGVRLVKVKREGEWIRMAAVLASDHDPEAQEGLSEAATYIIADFSDAKISEHYGVSDGPLPKENMLEEGWVFWRSEKVTECPR